MKRYYVGCSASERETFRSAAVPTFESHGEIYNVVIGPFQTKRGATFMAEYGFMNPHCQSVADAERLGREHKERGQWTQR